MGLGVAEGGGGGTPLLKVGGTVLISGIKSSVSCVLLIHRVIAVLK